MYSNNLVLTYRLKPVPSHRCTMNRFIYNIKFIRILNSLCYNKLS